MIYSYEQFIAMIEWINENSYWKKREEKNILKNRYTNEDYDDPNEIDITFSSKKYY